MYKAARIGIAATIALLAGCQETTEAPEKTVQQLMAEDVEPTAYVYWNAVLYGSDLERGDYEILPQTDEDWQKAEDAAARLIELANLLKTPAYTEGRGDDWVQFADSLAEASERARRAAEERSVEKIFEVGGIVYSVCSACHQVYPPAAGAEGARPGDEGATAPEAVES